MRALEGFPSLRDVESVIMQLITTNNVRGEKPLPASVTVQPPVSRRVLMLLANSFDPDPRVYSEARSLIRHGYGVAVLAWDRECKRPPKEVFEGIEIDRIHLRSVHNRGATQAYYMAATNAVMIYRGLRYRFDVVHAHDFDTLPAAYVLGRLRGKPVIYDSHEDYAGMLHGAIPSWMERTINWAEARFIRHVDLLITVGEKLKRSFEQRGCTHTAVVGNWKVISEYRLTPDVRSTLRGELQIPESALVLCCFGSLARERMLRELLEAAAAKPDVHVILGGAGPEMPIVQSYAARCKNIHYVGFVDPARLRAYTWASDVVYIAMDVTNPNSRYTAPNKLFEALAAGRCVLSGRYGELDHIVTTTGCGILVHDFSPASIMQGINACLDPGFLYRCQQNAKIAGETTYHWGLAESQLLESYEAIFRKSGQSGKSHA